MRWLGLKWRQFHSVCSKATSVVNKRTMRSEGPICIVPGEAVQPTWGTTGLEVTNAINLYLKGARYESQPGQYLESAMTASFQILPSPSFHPSFCTVVSKMKLLLKTAYKWSWRNTPNCGRFEAWHVFFWGGGVMRVVARNLLASRILTEMFCITN
jgi:hypothetical protein